MTRFTQLFPEDLKLPLTSPLQMFIFGTVRSLETSGKYGTYFGTSEGLYKMMFLKDNEGLQPSVTLEEFETAFGKLIQNALIFCIPGKDGRYSITTIKPIEANEEKEIKAVNLIEIKKALDILKQNGLIFHKSNILCNKL